MGGCWKLSDFIWAFMARFLGNWKWRFRDVLWILISMVLCFGILVKYNLVFTTLHA